MINFLDFKKAFDSVHRDSLWKIARSYGIPDQLVKVFRSLYSNFSCCVQTEQGTTEFFTIETGVRQGCILSPFLFLLTIDFVLRKTMGGVGFGIPWREPNRLTDLDFADDIALLGASTKSIQEMTTSLNGGASKVSLRISTDKTKVMRVGYAAAGPPITIGQSRIEEVQKLTYIGSTITSDGDADHDVACRIGKAGAVFRQLRPIWTTQTISTMIKIRLLNTIVVPTAIYTCETWKTNAKIERRINVAQQRWL
uniref:Reverse transcriptase domain-containing protein n=1 Tax=Amphilophus citrinellus TaxID=61819 RepID=A0A3Q0SHP5_AMPCI